MRYFHWGRQAFSLVELLMVMAIIGILASMSIPLFTQYINQSKSGRAAADLRAIEKSVTSFALDKNAMPATLADTGFNQVDPWMQAYIYSPTPTLLDIGSNLLNLDYDLYSKGYDGISADTPDATTENDIVRTNNGAYVGLRD